MHAGASALACVRASSVRTIMDECYRWWMGVTVWSQQSESLDECDGMISVEWMLWHECRGSVLSCIAWSRENVESLMSLWRTWEDYERFIFLVSAKEYRSKTDETRIENTKTNVACNYFYVKYDPEVPDNWLDSSNDLNSKEVCFRWFCMFRNAKNMHNNCVQIVLESFRTTQKWLHI